MYEGSWDMGTTIHYTVIVDDEDTVRRIKEKVLEEARKMGMTAEEYDGTGYVIPFITKMDDPPKWEVRENLSVRYGMNIPEYDHIPSIDETVAWIIREDKDHIEWGEYLFFPSLSRKDPSAIPVEFTGTRVEGSRYEAEDFSLLFFRAMGGYVASGFVKTYGNEPYHSNIRSILDEITKIDGVRHVYVLDEKDGSETIITRLGRKRKGKRREREV